MRSSSAVLIVPSSLGFHFATLVPQFLPLGNAYDITPIAIAAVQH
jgi:hypothetical protein